MSICAQDPAMERNSHFIASPGTCQLSPAMIIKAVPKFVELTQDTDVFTELRTDQKICSDGMRTEEANFAIELNIWDGNNSMETGPWCWQSRGCVHHRCWQQGSDVEVMQKHRCVWWSYSWKRGSGRKLKVVVALELNGPDSNRMETGEHEGVLV